MTAWTPGRVCWVTANSLEAMPLAYVRSYNDPETVDTVCRSINVGLIDCEERLSPGTARLDVAAQVCSYRSCSQRVNISISVGSTRKAIRI